MKIDYKIIDITNKNLNEFGLLCHKSKFKEQGYKNKLNWFIDKQNEGLRIKLLLVNEGEKRGFRSRGFIEYIPGENSFRGIEADGWMVIHCLWVIGKIKNEGLGSKLLDECFKDAKNMNGVVVVTSSKNWLRGNFFIKNGFEKIDESTPFELYIKKIKENTNLPKFIKISKEKIADNKKDLVIIKSDQCPYEYNTINYIKKIAESSKITYKIKNLSNSKELKNNCFSPYGSFCVLYKGRIISYYPFINEGIKNSLED